jgi:predicted nucleic acid-binding protein
MGVADGSSNLMVADTSFVSVLHAMTMAPAARNVLPCEARRSLVGAKLSISVVTVAELRAGHLKARWGARRRSQAERWLGRFAHLSVDPPVANAWAVLKDASRRNGRNCSENDLWIAATGYARGIPVVTCDRDFLVLRALGVKVVYVPRRRTASMLSR